MYAWVDEISARLVKTEKFDGRRRRDVRQIFSFSLRIGLTIYWIHCVNFVKSCTSWLFQVRQYIYSVNGENVLREDHHTVAQRIMGSNRDYINLCVMSHKRELKEKWTRPILMTEPYVKGSNRTPTTLVILPLLLY